jgi:hypothetical protein
VSQSSSSLEIPSSPAVSLEQPPKETKSKVRCEKEYTNLEQSRQEVRMMLEQPSSTISDEEYYSRILKRQLSSCGDLCVDDMSRRQPSKIPKVQIDSVRSHTTCCTIFGEPLFDAGSGRWPPPEQIPNPMNNEFTLGGKIPVTKMYFKQQYLKKAAVFENKWSRQNIEKWIVSASKDQLGGNYGVEEAKKLRSIAIKYKLQGKRILVIGSETPWLEAYLLNAGVGRITTLEYATITTDHPLIKSITPNEFNELYLNGTNEEYDAAFSFSSLEHSGLGRYGDVLNPWGDVIAAAKVWCVVKPGGIFALGLMTTCELLYFNKILVI